ncbi:MAG: MBL fold metallo-hydrolase [Promethearchaeota archaeon]
MELIKITDQVFYIPNPANIGVIKDGKESVILIDSGLDKNTGKKILRLLDNSALSVKAIINTHSHADHCGGNNYIKEKTGAVIYAPEIESTIIQHPFLEPFFLFSGANPLKDLQNKFLMAQPSDVDYVIKKDDKKLTFNEIEIEITPLPGHAPNQIGLEADSVFFCADVLFSEDILEKHKVPFFIDIDRTRKTLIFLKETHYNFYVPSHAELRANLVEVIDANLEVINSIENYLLDIVHERKTTEQVLKELCDHYQIQMNGAQQYFLMKTAIMAYLSSLRNKEQLKVKLKNNFLFWEKSH